MKLLTPVLLLSVFSSLTLTEVVQDVKRWKFECRGFFMPNPKKLTEPVIPTVLKGHQYKKICQRWKNVYRFATLYDTVSRIPVYSAYTISKKENTTRNDDWKIEPQLDNIKVPIGADVRDMMDSSDVTDVRQIKNQAVYSDYTGTGYTRGHVFPYSFAADQDQADSTFTLTNIAPQTEDSNGGWETQVEKPMLKNINNNCKLGQNHQAYIVTGVVPGKKWLNITRDEENIKQINVPSHFWSAFCCTSKTSINQLIWKAYIAKLENFTAWPETIHSLNKRLTGLYNQYFRVFQELPVKD